ncbi:MAG TPA: hypothetical protein VGI98_03385 [Candidatus Limnocylindrales bacterium]|jgi:hypothetical protein
MTEGMDDPRWEPGMPVLDRQAVPQAGAAGTPAAASRPPDRIPETAPTPLQRHYINLSAIALVAGFVAITALETGSTFGSPLVKLCVLIGGPILIVTTGDAILRIWRSAWAWMPVNRGRGLFRLSWVVVGLIGVAVIAVAWIAVLLA